jgi:hypothetical protein
MASGWETSGLSEEEDHTSRDPVCLELPEETGIELSLARTVTQPGGRTARGDRPDDTAQKRVGPRR